MQEDSDNDQTKYEPHKPKVIQPASGDDDDAPMKEPLEKGEGVGAAVELIRQKIDAIYSNEPDAEAEIEEVEEVEAADKPLSKHQRYIQELSDSGKSLAEVQTAWHEYYQNLPDDEKHEVWQEFYSQAKPIEKKKPAAASQSKPKATGPAEGIDRDDKPTIGFFGGDDAKDPRSVKQIKNQLRGKIQERANAKPQSHAKSLLFGLTMGVLSIMVLMFGLFNERIIAPFITPSRTVSSTPIISDLNGQAAGDEPRIIIPKINVDIPVVFDEPSIEEDQFQKALEDGVVHYATTPKPGEKGNAAIFGHSSNNILNPGKYKFAFVLLSRLQDGDTFMVERAGKRYVYKVYHKEVVKPTNLGVLDKQEREATVSLITCDPPGTVQNRLVVVGEQISPDPSLNIASDVEQKVASDEEPEILPSNAPSLWNRLFGWLGG